MGYLWKVKTYSFTYSYAMDDASLFKPFLMHRQSVTELGISKSPTILMGIRQISQTLVSQSLGGV